MLKDVAMVRSEYNSQKRKKIGYLTKHLALHCTALHCIVLVCGSEDCQLTCGFCLGTLLCAHSAIGNSKLSIGVGVSANGCFCIILMGEWVDGWKEGWMNG